MTLTELADLVRRMREAQRQYFAHRSPDALALAKELERATDAAVKSVLSPAPKPNPTLFGEEEPPC